MQTTVSHEWLDIMDMLFMNNTDFFVMVTCIGSGWDLWQES